jgi:hypothetical protein
MIFMELERLNLKETFVLILFGAVFAYSLVMLMIGTIGFNEPKITGHATETTTVSNVTIAKYLAIDMSVNLSGGIMFGNVATLPATNVNATHNYDGVSSGTSMFLNVSNDSNTNVDFCIKANAALTDSTSGNIIGIGNETYYNSTTTNITIPDLASELAITTGYVRAGSNITKGNSNYYRFWLDVPASTSSGSYNNTVWFKGTETGQAC